MKHILRHNADTHTSLAWSGRSLEFVTYMSHAFAFVEFSEQRPGSYAWRTRR